MTKISKHQRRTPARIRRAHHRRDRKLRPVLVFRSGEPAAAIAAVTVCPPSQELSSPDYRITPLFVSTPGMTLVDYDGREA